MTAKHIKVLISYIEDDFKLYINTEKGLVEVKNLELNIENKSMVINPKPHL